MVIPHQIIQAIGHELFYGQQPHEQQWCATSYRLLLYRKFSYEGIRSDGTWACWGIRDVGTITHKQGSGTLIELFGGKLKSRPLLRPELITSRPLCDEPSSVRLVASEASERCGLAPGPYTLVVTQSALHLRDDQRVLYIWPYRFIRRYGHRQGKFTFEAGRKCESGEGTFHMEHSNQQEIFRCISSKMKNMKKLLTGESLSSPAILCGDNQFHAALNMMARSRSPLPPSPTGSTPLLDAELCSISSAKPLIPVPVEPLQRSLKPPLPFKPKPMKPPRKNLPAITVNDSDENCSKEHQNQNADNCADYDDIEVRNDAWKTMGLGVMPHSERPFSSRTEEPLEMQTNWQQCEEHHYDKLQHLGPTNKPHPRPGYRQIVGIAPALPPPCASEDTVRAADDSHLGYGVIRKKPVPAEETQPANVGPPHQVYNNMEYAIVCKPNRV
ncbi:transmembrane receptor protein tyrosine kinase adaptor activity protein [Homalodisca vitripennis]|nr:transmembrane receptor protein tyrosine kinase adaptor activity protein [Homalodisca vitripennis]